MHIQYDFSSQGQLQEAKWPAVLCHDEWDNIFASEQVRTKFYQIWNLTLRMDILAFLNSVVNDSSDGQCYSRLCLGEYAKL
jgi:hypothetical protein